MTPIVNTPEKLKPYVSSKVILDIPPSLTGVGSVYGTCPWCNSEKKFNVTLSEGLWRCLKCNIGTEKGGGNVYTFLSTLHQLSMESTTDRDYELLAKDFGLLFGETLKVWGVCKSIIDGKWIVPGYNVQNGTKSGGKITTMYRYAIYDVGSKKARWGVTAGLSHGLWGPDVPTPKGGLQPHRKRIKNGEVFRCEGLKDGMALYEVLLRCKRSDGGKLLPTANEEASILWSGSVIAVPGAEVFAPSWASVSGSRVDCSFYHNDYPKQVAGTSRTRCAGADGTRKVIDILLRSSTPPKELKYYPWGEKSFHNLDLPDGYDVRDYLMGPSKTNDLTERIKIAENLLGRLKPPPKEWLTGRTGIELTEETCTEWKVLLNALRAILKVTDGIIRTFAAGLASILSVPSTGDQLWLMVIGPPSSAKSTLCELWSANRMYVLPKDTLTGLFSGWQMGLQKDENLSLAGEMHNKTLVIKDAATVLDNPKCSEIMSQLRALYDRAVRTQFKNRMSKNWEGLNSTVILCGTATLYTLDAAEKGTRYLTVNIQPTHDYDLEDEITMRKSHEAFRNMEIDAAGAVGGQDTEESIRAKKLTAGYITYLRQNATTLIKNVKDEDGSSLRMCGALATFVSYMRCRPPKKQTEKVEREMPYRLTSQFVRLARGLAVVFGKTEMDDEVMSHVKQIALDTAYGTVLTICDFIRAKGESGVISPVIAQAIGKTPDDTLELLMFLHKIQALDAIVPNPTAVVRTGRPHWILSRRLSKLYDTIFGTLASPR